MIKFSRTALCAAIVGLCVNAAVAAPKKPAANVVVLLAAIGPLWRPARPDPASR